MAARNACPESIVDRRQLLARSFHKPLDEFSHTRMVRGKKGFRGEFHPLQKCYLSDAVHEWRPTQRFNAFRKNSIEMGDGSVRRISEESDFGGHPVLPYGAWVTGFWAAYSAMLTLVGVLHSNGQSGYTGRIPTTVRPLLINSGECDVNC